MTFQVGQRVVCIWSDWGSLARSFKLTVPVKGCIYTVSQTHPGGGIWVAEINNAGTAAWDNHSFSADGFRPVRDTDISIFEAMFSPEPVEA